MVRLNITSGKITVTGNTRVSAKRLLVLMLRCVMILILENSERKTRIYWKIMRTVTGEFDIVILEKSWEGQIAHFEKNPWDSKSFEKISKKSLVFLQGNFQRKRFSWEPSTVYEYL